MEPPTDRDLLRRFRESGDDAAFTELVTRHCSLVWATALRTTGDRDLARDVTQTVFTVLARKASRLADSVVVPGWLHRAACLEAAKQVRNDRRRIHRELNAMKERESDPAAAAPPSPAETAALEPLLDEALDALGDTDRQAVVLRFLSGRSFSEIGMALGVTDDTAQKRVSRALDRMRDWFQARGVPVREGLTSACLGAAATVSAPPGLAASVATTVLSGAAAATLAPAGWILMNSKLLITSAAAIAVATVGWQQGRLGRLENDNAALRRALAEPVPAPVVISAAAAALPDLSGDERAELLRLR
ncbi:MAG: sigma-70 family RNA polymerase sigma factor, partial [Verrucomicrobia bacterium]|nr:sigma-70 family RNA polymerase sigma factor [Verrucomicrobiota bacterium]